MYDRGFNGKPPQGVIKGNDRLCYYCSEFKPLDNWPVKNHNKCRDCYRLYKKYNRMDRDAEKKPYKYNVCNGCDRTFSKFRYQEVKVNCTFCGSSDIESYD